MFPGQAAGIWLFSSRTKEHFGDEDIFVSWPGELFQGGAHLDFTLSIGVDLSSCSKLAGCCLGDCAL